MNPCPCGFAGEPDGRCKCTPHDVDRYRARLSGPLLDRIDLQVRVRRVTWDQLQDATLAESSATVRARVVEARNLQTGRRGSGERQQAKQGGSSDSSSRGRSNARLTPAEVRLHCLPTAAPATRLLRDAVERYHLSARGFDRVLKVSRTIADLAGDSVVEAPHIAEALQYRLTGNGPAASEITRPVPSGGSSASPGARRVITTAGERRATSIGATP
jgi:magnesium chelatase family protein